MAVSNMTMYVALVEDNPMAGKILKEYVESDDIQVIAHYTTGEDALSVIPTLPLPDTILMDIGLPGISGIEVTQRLKERFPDLNIIIQTVFEDAETIVAAIKAGANGYILKASPKEEIIKALMNAKKGEAFLSGKVAKKILQEFQRPKGRIDYFPERFDLTPKEEEILKELMTGAAYKEIADRLSVSVNTVNKHIQKIYEKLQVNSRGEAVAKITEGGGS